MRWFGAAWGAPVCDAKTLAPTPTGRQCVCCYKVVRADDQGVFIPHVGTTDGQYMEQPWHLDCFTKSLGIGSRAAAE